MGHDEGATRDFSARCNLL